MIRLLIGLVLYAAVVLWCWAICRSAGRADAYIDHCLAPKLRPRRREWMKVWR